MKCPECDGKVTVIETRNNAPLNEIYRERKCRECGCVFYTLEFEIESDNAFEKEWHNLDRRLLKRKRERELRELKMGK
jgi:transcriptional regulator NrdR family protein